MHPLHAMSTVLQITAPTHLRAQQKAAEMRGAEHPCQQGIAQVPSLQPPACRAQQKVAEMRGADPAGLRRAIDQQLALLGPSTSGASSSGGAGGISAAGMAMCNELAKVGRPAACTCDFDQLAAEAHQRWPRCEHVARSAVPPCWPLAAGLITSGLRLPACSCGWG